MNLKFGKFEINIPPDVIYLIAGASILITLIICNRPS